MEEKVKIIKYSNKRLYLSLIGAAIFVVASIFMLINAPFISDNSNSSIVLFVIKHTIGIKGVGILGFTFFGFIGVFIVKNMLNPIALKISPEGIYHRKFGLILWNDIKSIDSFKVKRTIFVRIYVYDTEKYLNRISNVIQKKMAIIDNKLYKSPINFSPKSYSINFQDFYHLLEKGLENYKKKTI